MLKRRDNRMRRLVSLLFLVAAAPLAAQSEGATWRVSNFPYIIGNPTTGPMLVARWQIAQQADYDARVQFAGIFSVEAGASALGSRFVNARFRAPLLRDGWRFAGDLSAFRESRLGFYGLGPETAGDAAPPLDAEPYLFRARRTRYLARGEVTRQLSGPLQLAVAGGVEHSAWSALPGQSVFREQFGISLSQTDVHGRLAMVLDLRDHEVLTTRGFLGETGLVLGNGGNSQDGDLIAFGPYAGWYAHLRGYISPRRGTVIAARVAARSVSDEATLSARFDLPAWERDISAIGGAETHRSFVKGRFGGRGLLLSSLEVRHNLIDVGDYGAVTLLGFTDAGRVFESTDFKLTLSDFQVGYGGGLSLRVLRWAILVFNFAGGPDGFNFTMGQGFAF
jgi:hypothetical protein